MFHVYTLSMFSSGAVKYIVVLVVFVVHSLEKVRNAEFRFLRIYRLPKISILRL